MQPHLDELYKKIYLRALSTIFMLIKYQKFSFFLFLKKKNLFYFIIFTLIKRIQSREPQLETNTLDLLLTVERGD